MSSDFKVKPISFDQCKEYWIEVDHFEDPKKKILEYVKTLGPFVTDLEDPQRQAYGLFDNDELIGVTQLVRWSDEWVRYRTINIRKSYRGRSLGALLIKEAYDRDWSHMPYLFGWTKKSHVDWALKNDFSFINDDWVDDHIGMLKEMRRS
jgi:GNAT superfamily N-acetyltransferase